MNFDIISYLLQSKFEKKSLRNVNTFANFDVLFKNLSH